jgi:hypothetical protein
MLIKKLDEIAIELKTHKGIVECGDGAWHAPSPGNIFYYQNGVRHREDGPAILWIHGARDWYLNGQMYPSENDIKIALEKLKK